MYKRDQMSTDADQQSIKDDISQSINQSSQSINQSINQSKHIYIGPYVACRASPI